MLVQVIDVDVYGFRLVDLSQWALSFARNGTGLWLRVHFMMQGRLMHDLGGTVELLVQLGWMIVAWSKSFRGEMVVVLRWWRRSADPAVASDITACVGRCWNR